MEGGIAPLLLLPAIQKGAELGVSIMPMILGILTFIISLIILIIGLIIDSKGTKIASYIGFGLGFLLIGGYMVTRMIAANRKG